MKFGRLRQRFVNSVSDVGQNIPDGKGIPFFDEYPYKARFWRNYIRGGFGGFEGEKQRAFFDGLAVFDVDADQPRLRLVGVQKGNEDFGFDHRG